MIKSFCFLLLALAGLWVPSYWAGLVGPTHWSIFPAMVTGTAALFVGIVGIVSLWPEGGKK